MSYGVEKTRFEKGRDEKVKIKETQVKFWNVFEKAKVERVKIDETRVKIWNVLKGDCFFINPQQ